MTARLRMQYFLFMAGIVSAMYVMCYFLTGFISPSMQWRAVIAIAAGPKHARSAKEMEVNFAIFHLDKATANVLGIIETESCPVIPNSWNELIWVTGSYRGPHLKGTLTQSYPFLKEDRDPWGHLWIYRVEQSKVGAADGVLHTIVFGSTGPDGMECSDQIQALPYEARRAACDDLLQSFHILIE